MLVRVKDSNSRPRRVVREHGLLWIRVEPLDERDDLHMYRSLATGYRYLWYTHEVEKAGANE